MSEIQVNPWTTESNSGRLQPLMPQEVFSNNKPLLKNKIETHTHNSSQNRINALWMPDSWTIILCLRQYGIVLLEPDISHNTPKHEIRCWQQQSTLVFINKPLHLLADTPWPVLYCIATLTTYTNWWPFFSTTLLGLTAVFSDTLLVHNTGMYRWGFFAPESESFDPILL